ncbi:MAG: hypothetical protein QOJ38_756 [Solirubrobacterales bacterium]|nr:hypothetical protein [Solirubrobacterales bacterium]
MPVRPRIHRFLAAVSLAVLSLLATSAPAFAADGTGLAGRVSDKTITFFCFGVILFFPILVTVLSLVQGRLEANKDRRRHELDRFGELDES